MQYLPELVFNDPQYHDTAYTFNSTTGTARTTAKEHTDGQQYPSNMRPCAGIIVEKTGSGNETDHLKNTTPKGIFQVVMAVDHELAHDKEAESTH